MSDSTPRSSNDAPSGTTRAQSKRQEKARQRSVIFYLGVMFTAAFLLLSLSLLMERRQRAEDMNDLNQSLTGLKNSVSAMQSVEQLYEDNAALKEQINQLEQQLEATRSLAAQQETALSDLSLKLERTEQALDYFWQIDEAFVRGRYSLCRELISVLEDSSKGYTLKEYLPAQSTTNNDRFSPADRYLEIYGKVN